MDESTGPHPFYVKIISAPKCLMRFKFPQDTSRPLATSSLWSRAPLRPPSLPHGRLVASLGTGYAVETV
jgi:hypothetical protein